MFNKIFFILLIVVNVTFAQVESEKSIAVEIPLQDMVTDLTDEEKVLLLGLKKVIFNTLGELQLDATVFQEKLSQKITTEKWTNKDELTYLKSFFENVTVSFPAPLDPKEIKVTAETIEAPKKSLNGKIQYNLKTSEQLKNLYTSVISGLPDLAKKIFFIYPQLEISNSTLWTDLGVSERQVFVSVIESSWKKWAEENFKNFETVFVLKEDLKEKVKSDSVVLKWKSVISKKALNEESHLIHFDISAQYVLVNLKTNQTLHAFDFPDQKRSLNSKNSKNLSSSLASLVFNLLNSQTSKIQSSLEVMASSHSLQTKEIVVNFKALNVGLSDIYRLNSWLNESFVDISLSSELKTYDADKAILTIKSTLSAEQFMEKLAKDGGKFPFNEQKILIFNSADKTFAIIAKEQNN